MERKRDSERDMERERERERDEMRYRKRAKGERTRWKALRVIPRGKQRLTVYRAHQVTRRALVLEYLSYIIQRRG